MRWVITQPEGSLSPTEAFAELDQAFYSLGNDKYVTDAWQASLIRTHMNPALENICSVLYDELGVAFDKWFGTQSDSWKEIHLFETMRMVVSQGASRFTVGLPLGKSGLRTVHQNSHLPCQVAVANVGKYQLETLNICETTWLFTTV
jgi:hypothetical protein